MNNTVESLGLQEEEQVAAEVFEGRTESPLEKCRKACSIGNAFME